MHAAAEVWLDNGVIEVFVGSGSAMGSAVLSAFYPKLYNQTAGLAGAVWCDQDVSAAFRVEWSSVASVDFDHQSQDP